MHIDGIQVKFGNKQTINKVKDIVKRKNNVALRIFTKTGVRYKYLVSAPCAFCNKTMYHSKDSIRSYGHVFCDHDCQHKFTRLRKDPKNAGILLNQTNNFFYLLGWIATDGTILYPTKGKRYKANSIRLHLKDKEILEQMKSTFGGHLHYRAPYYVWDLSNKELLSYLIHTVGLSTNKSKSLNVTSWFLTLTEEQQRHFIRGCWDGDGTIHVRSTGYFVASIFTASSTFLNLLTTYFQQYHFKVYTEITATGTTFNRLSFHGSHSIAPMHRIYGNLLPADMVLRRKQKKFNQLAQRWPLRGAIEDYENGFSTR